MRYFIAALLAAIVIGCGTVSDKPHAGTIADTNSAARDQGVTGGSAQSEHMPGGIGVTAGQSGTGTTSGASTGY